MKAILIGQRIPGEGGSSGGGGGLRKIEVTTQPTKTRYLSGETFDKSGMVITASYGVGPVIVGTAEVPSDQYTVTPTLMTDGITAVTITYMEGGDTVSCDLPVTVIHALTKIEVTTNPTKTIYEYDDSFSTAGMVVTASYTDGVQTELTSYTHSPSGALKTLGDQNITISYQEEGITKTTTYPITVERKSVTKPTWKSNLTYKDSGDHIQTVTATSYWNNYNTNYMTIGGTTSGANAGTYKASFTPGTNYRWADKSIDTIEVSWVIDKAVGSISANPTILNITSGATSVSSTLTTYNTGVISISPISQTGLISMSISGKTFTVVGDGSTKVNEFDVTISAAADDNHTSASCIVKVAASYWEWGDETATADANWFSSLKNALPTMSSTEKEALIGKTKSVTLSTAILETTTHLIRCIDVDKDGPNTATFQTKNCLNVKTRFGSSSSSFSWIGSYVRSYCNEYYHAFPGKNNIKTVKKGTCPDSTGSSRNNEVTYNDETVFLLSEREFGLDSFSPLSTINSSTSRAECTKGVNSPYKYYDSDDKRIMHLGDSNTSYSGSPYERSRDYASDDAVCNVQSKGAAGRTNYFTPCGFAPAFVIG